MTDKSPDPPSGAQTVLRRKDKAPPVEQTKPPAPTPAKSGPDPDEDDLFNDLPV
jgi:hypothetical protein